MNFCAILILFIFSSSLQAQNAPGGGTIEKIRSGVRTFREVRKRSSEIERKQIESGALSREREFKNKIKSGELGENIGGEEVFRITQYTLQIFDEYLRDIAYKTDPTVPSADNSNLDNLANFHLAYFETRMSYHKGCNVGRDSGSFDERFNTRYLNPTEMVRLDELPFDPVLLKRLKMSIPEEGITDFYFFDGEGKVIKVSLSKDSTRVYAMRAHIPQVEPEEASNVPQRSGIEIASYRFGDTEISFDADAVIDESGLDKFLQKGHLAKGKLTIDHEGNQIYGSVGLEIRCKEGSRCERLSDYRDIYLAEIGHVSKYTTASAAISTDEDVLQFAFIDGPLKGAKATMNYNQDLEVEHALDTFLFGKPISVLIRVEADRGASPRVSVEGQNQAGEQFSVRHSPEQAIASYSTPIKISQTSCRGIVEGFYNNQSRPVDIVQHYPDASMDQMSAPRFGSDSVVGEGAGMALTIHCGSL